MLVTITSIEKLYSAPPGTPDVYRIEVEFSIGGRAEFPQVFVVRPRLGEVWEMARPELQKLISHPDGSPR